VSRVHPASHPDLTRADLAIDSAAGFADGGVVLRDLGSESERQRIVDDLFDYCRKNFAAKMMPRRILTVDKIPRGALGRIARAELHAMRASS
jgi:acyl-CoA synthetase (AMP-forming)/AMP-acid ligase II